MYTAFPLSLRAGQSGLIRLSWASLPSEDLSVLIDASIPADCSPDSITLPAGLPPGVHTLSLRAGQKELCSTLFEVQPSPLASSPGMQTFQAYIPPAGSPIEFLSEPGPRGPVGPTGPAGDPGRDGTDGTDGRDGSPTLEQQLAAVSSYLPQTTVFSTPEPDNDLSCSYGLYNYIARPPEGKLLAINLWCRLGVDIADYSAEQYPLYLIIWQEQEDGSFSRLGVSSLLRPCSSDKEPQIYFKGSFAGLSLSGNPIYLGLHDSPDVDSWENCVGTYSYCIDLQLFCTPTNDGSFFDSVGSAILCLDFILAKASAGQDGAPGSKGDTGPAGSPGRDGADGTDGTDGTDGEGASLLTHDPDAFRSILWLLSAYSHTDNDHTSLNP